MPKEIVHIRLSEGLALESAARFLAALAYPEDPEIRDRFRIAFCHEALVGKMKGHPKVGKVLVPAEYLDPMPGLYRQGLTRIHARERAGSMLLAMCGPELFGLDPKPSVNRVAGLVAKSTNSANVKHRDWKPSLPVIHAACAFVLVLERMVELGLRNDPDDFIHEPELISAAVRWSEQVRTQIMPSLGGAWKPPREHETIQFVLSGPDQ